MNILATAAALILALPGAVAAETALRWASVGGALTFDPHSVNESPTYAQVTQVYESLVNVDSSLTLVAQLARSWTLVDPLTWRFELRPDVHFHDGAPFTAEDVVFSIERAKSPSSQKKYYIASVADVRAIGPHTVEITTAVPDLLLPAALRPIEIMSKAWAEAHSVSLPADFRAGEETDATRHANGTGAFMLEAFEPEGPAVMVRNPDWWGFAEAPPDLDRVLYTPIPDPDQRLAAVLAGTLDLLIDPPLDALERIRATPGWKLAQATQPRSIFFGLDQGRPELRSSDVRGRNPLADRRVREAMYRAIDARAIRDEVMRGLSAPAGMIISPGNTGYAEDLDQRLPHDLPRARALLAEAGYADGFRLDLNCPNDRYINDAAICERVARQLAEVGIEAKVVALPKGEHFKQVRRREVDFWMQGWSSATFDSLDVFLNFFHSDAGPYNATGYANPEVDALIAAVRGELVTHARDALIEQVWRLVLDDVVYLPLHNQVIVWAMRDELDLPVFPLNRPIFREVQFRNPPNQQKKAREASR